MCIDIGEAIYRIRGKAVTVAATLPRAPQQG